MQKKLPGVKSLISWERLQSKMSGHFFSDDEIAQDPILQYFDYEHLPSFLQKVSSTFANCASTILTDLPRSAERTMAFRKLLEAKDCAVRARI